MRVLASTYGECEYGADNYQECVTILSTVPGRSSNSDPTTTNLDSDSAAPTTANPTDPDSDSATPNDSTNTGTDLPEVTDRAESPPWFYLASLVIGLSLLFYVLWSRYHRYAQSRRGR